MIDVIETTEDSVTGTYELKVVGDLRDVARVEEYAVVMMDKEDEEVDMLNHPSHYIKSGIECIHEMILLFGVEETRSFCKLNSHKYRKRAMDKGGREDLDKADWYIKMYANLLTMTDQEAIEWILELYKDYLYA